MQGLSIQYSVYTSVQIDSRLQESQFAQPSELKAWLEDSVVLTLRIERSEMYITLFNRAVLKIYGCE